MVLPFGSIAQKSLRSCCLDRAARLNASVIAPILLVMPVVLYWWAKLESTRHNTVDVQQTVLAYLIAVSGAAAAFVLGLSGSPRLSAALQVLWRASGVCSLWVWSDLGRNLSSGKGWVHSTAHRWRLAATRLGAASLLLILVTWCAGIRTSATALTVAISTWPLVRVGLTIAGWMVFLAWAGYFFNAFLPYRALRRTYQPLKERLTQLDLDLFDKDHDFVQHRSGVTRRAERPPWAGLASHNTKPDPDASDYGEMMKIMTSTVRVTGPDGRPVLRTPDDFEEDFLHFWYCLETTPLLAQQVRARVRKARKMESGVKDVSAAAWSEAMSSISMVGYGRRWQPGSEPDLTWGWLALSPEDCLDADDNVRVEVPIAATDPTKLVLFQEKVSAGLRITNKARTRLGQPPLGMTEYCERRLEELCNEPNKETGPGIRSS